MRRDSGVLHSNRLESGRSGFRRFLETVKKTDARGKKEEAWNSRRRTGITTRERERERELISIIIKVVEAIPAIPAIPASPTSLFTAIPLPVDLVKLRCSRPGRGVGTLKPVFRR